MSILNSNFTAVFLGVVMFILAIPASHGEIEKKAPLSSLRLTLPEKRTPVVDRIAELFQRQIQQRCNAKVCNTAESPLNIALSIEPGIGLEGYKIDDGLSGTINIIGNDERGLLYGVGKFLHTSTYNSDGFTASSWQGNSVPAMPVRGIYLATHFQNYYQVAPIDEVTQYIEELSLWGTNSFLVWFAMEEFDGINNPKAQAMIERLRALLKIVKGLGLDASLGCVANDGYSNSPQDLRATMVDCCTGRELCPSKPGVLEVELKYCQEKFDAFKSIGLDYWFIWPYDTGGCGCSKCAPWGANGYLRMAEPLARAYRHAFPKGKVILGTWLFDRWAPGEWAGMADKFNKQKPDWVDYIMADSTSDYPRYPLDNGVPGGLPLLNFPEISMWGQEPWGGYGANPYPSRIQGRWDQTRKKLSGGFPYSEGIYEDLNKVICTQLYWDPNRPAIEAVKEYIAFEFSPEVVDDMVSVVNIFEKNHVRKQNENNIDESAITAYQLIEKTDARLTPQVRRSWRWRLFYLRAVVDHELYKNKLSQGRDEVFQQADNELMVISHTQNANPILRPTPPVSTNKAIK